jgi:7,8-dihydropterin-6-yl-methyl-4-(beta-D-ribofuranosyl)aminobenzene 5'-phosphate synthase
MRIVNLIENTEGTSGCACAHGLSFYLETPRHHALMDVGPSAAALENAARLGIDLHKIDTVILSHGHYDHSGGIVPFAALNSRAAILMQRTAVGEYYADDGEAADTRYRYIGIDRQISALPQVRFLQGDTVIDEEMELFTIRRRTHELPFANKRLLIRQHDGYVRDTFRHEQFLVLTDGGVRVLLSGCAHNGILSIMDAYRAKYGGFPDAVISGFHLMVKREYAQEELEEIRQIAAALRSCPCMFFTCHCTGPAAYEAMKSVMGEQLRYVHSGDEICL